MHFENHKRETCKLFGHTDAEGALNAMASLHPKLHNMHRISTHCIQYNADEKSIIILT